LLLIIYSTGAKGSTQTNKKIQVRVQKKGAKETEENPGLAHRTVRCATGQCPVPRAVRLQTCHLRVSGEPLRYNSPDCLVCHRSNGYQAQRSTLMVACNVNSVRTVRAESEQRQKAHWTMNSAYPVRHRTVQCLKMSELQRSKPSEP
jgi:hypothetical protein